MAKLTGLPGSLDPGLAAALSKVGIESLYSHQAAAYETARHSHLILTSGTASGKSLSFNLPVLNGIAEQPLRRAFYLYPTKALAQDQARKLGELRPPGLREAIYDGDTPREERPSIRRRANLVLTNPDMLHVGVLPHHKRWGDFLANLGWVVVDEAHTYRGVFGSHVANVLRRLRRVARLYGAEPRFVLASATIANPGELAERLTGLPFELLDDDGAPRAGREIGMWNPPVIEQHTMTRRSPVSEAADLLVELVSRGVRTICFMRSRRGIELINRFASMKLAEEGKADLADRIAPYRAGYTPQQRREIESQLSSGELLAVAATDALELGIDVGELDAAICVNFPGTVASLRQMWGRAGRRRRGLAVYVAGEDALDQFFCRHPDEFLERPVEAAILDHPSEQIQMQHLVAAAYEAPLGPDDDEIFGEGWQQRAEQLVTTGELRRGRADRYLTRTGDFVAGRISLRSSSADSVAVVDSTSGEMIGNVEAERAFSTVHPGAIYLHFGRSYEVAELDVGSRRAMVKPFEGDYYTQVKKETDVWVEGMETQRRTLGVELNFGTVSVSEQVIAYQRKRLGDNKVLDIVALDLPEQNFVTQALWYVIGDRMAAALPSEVLLGALHASEHGQIAVLPLIAMCDRWDIGGLSTNIHHQTGSTIFIYDGHPGGIGITRLGYEKFERLVSDADRLIRECPCDDGCPSCVQSPKCGNLNEPLHKWGAGADGADAAGGQGKGLVTQRVQISVIGASEGAAEILRHAEAVGRGIAEAGAVLVCGGLTGVMEAASKGASEAGGTVLAVLPTLSPADANPYVTHALATGTGHARNLAVVASGEAVIAVGGEWGTLSEIAYARKLGRPVVAIQSWTLRNHAGTDLGIVEAETPEEAVKAALSTTPSRSG
jgi:TIGR00725 family protein